MIIGFRLVDYLFMFICMLLGFFVSYLCLLRVFGWFVVYCIMSGFGIMVVMLFFNLY